MSVFYSRWETVSWVGQQCHFQRRISAWWLPFLWLPPLLFMAPTWRRRVDLKIYNHHCHSQHHPLPLSSLGASCFLLLPLLPIPFCPAPYWSQWLSPPQRIKYKKSLCGPGQLQRGLIKPTLPSTWWLEHIFFLSCSLLSPRAWSRVTAGLQLLTSSDIVRTLHQRPCLYQLNGAWSVENLLHYIRVNTLFPGKRGVWWLTCSWRLVLWGLCPGPVALLVLERLRNLTISSSIKWGFYYLPHGIVIRIKWLSLWKSLKMASWS